MTLGLLCLQIYRSLLRCSTVAPTSLSLWHGTKSTRQKSSQPVVPITDPSLKGTSTTGRSQSGRPRAEMILPKSPCHRFTMPRSGSNFCWRQGWSSSQPRLIYCCLQSSHTSSFSPCPYATSIRLCLEGFPAQWAIRTDLSTKNVI